MLKNPSQEAGECHERWEIAPREQKSLLSMKCARILDSSKRRVDYGLPQLFPLSFWALRMSTN
jgi:hypothetical protein